MESNKKRELFFSRFSGFTLAEVLVVVVIVGILASLAIPRFFGQAEKAKAAEAINMLSAIRRAQLQYYDAHDKTYASIPAHCGTDGADVATSIDAFSNLLGIKIPSCASAHWAYSTDTSMSGSTPANPIAKATRKPLHGEAIAANSTITIDDDGTWKGSGDYKNPSGNPPVGAGKYWPF
jgi:prepilin-type N-terminal cleavage/methylation domain-containing protein